MCEWGTRERVLVISYRLRHQPSSWLGSGRSGRSGCYGSWRLIQRVGSISGYDKWTARPARSSLSSSEWKSPLFCIGIAGSASIAAVSRRIDPSSSSGTIPPEAEAKPKETKPEAEKPSEGAGAGAGEGKTKAGKGKPKEEFEEVESEDEELDREQLRRGELEG
jgi:hypothetical protein